MQNFNKNLSKSDIDKVNKGKKEKKDAPKIKKSTIVFRVIEITIACAYVLLLAFGRLFDFLNTNDYYISMDLFSGAEAPFKLIRFLSIVLLVLTASSFVHLLLGFVRKRALARRGRVAIIDLVNNLVKYVTVIIVFCFVFLTKNIGKICRN